MDFINRLAEILARIGQMIEKNKRAVTALACLVVFITTYALILPAITLDEHSAADQGGIDLKTEQQADTQTDAQNEKQEVTTGDQQTDGQAAGDTEKTPQTGEQKDSSDSKASDDSEKAVGGESKEGVTEKTSEEADKKDDSKTEEKKDDADKAAAQTLKYKGGDYKVTAKCGKNADIPEGAELKVKEIRKNSSDPSEQALYKKYYDKATKAIQNDTGDKDKELRFARFFDITFLDKDGKEIEPSAKVEIKIEYDKAVDLKKVDGVKAVHFDEKSGSVKTKVIDVDTTVSSNEKMSDASFKASEFSVYALVGSEKTIETSVLTAEGRTYKITVTYDDEAGIPDGAQLSAKEISKRSDDYDKYLEKSAKKLCLEGKEDISFARFFDIEITKDGEKIEPKTAVKVSITYDDALEMPLGGNLDIVHFAKEGTEIIDSVHLNSSKTELSYKQDSFSVTGTVVSGGPRNGQQYMLIAEYEGKNYLINNDGTLIPVTDVNANEITTDNPMLWTYYYQYGAHFRFASEASGFNSDQTASGFYYRYLDPNSETGLTEENALHPHLEESTQINYNNNRVSSVSNNNYYIGVSDEGGPLHITGKNNNAHSAKITLYSANQVRPSDPANHTVNHIDISISGSAEVDVPLAYGYYYYKDGSNWKMIKVGSNVEADPEAGAQLEKSYENLTLKLTQDHVGITANDMKKATITAKDKNGNVVDNAFYITGYSANETTAYSTDQVRIEGSFKVSTIDPVNWWEANSPDVRHRRKDNKITYTVEAKKPLELPLLYTDENGNKFQLYHEMSEAEPMTINAQVPLSASFDYWTRTPGVGNECPPLQEAWGYTTEWQDGGIHPWGISGMDFVLHAGVVNVPADVLALEISKKIVDENGNTITNITQPIDATFEVYRDKPGDPSTVREVGSEIHDYGTYQKLHDKTMTIGTNGTGHKFDYNVNDGMYYVRESREGLPSKITTTNGETYNYIRTEIKTEYSYRANQYRTRDPETGKTITQTMHSTTISNPNADLNSIPEVLGDYKDDNNENEKNEFLEFYFVNVYSKTETPPPPEPMEKTFNIHLDKNWQDGNNTQAPTTGTVTFKLHQIQTQNNQSQTDVPGSGYPKTITLRAEDGWKTTIPNLPWYETDTHNNYEKTFKYYLEEDVSQSTGGAAAYGVPSFTNGFGSINKPVTGENQDETITVEATNKTGNVMRIQKRWINIDPETAPEITVKVWRQEVDSSNNPIGNPYQYMSIQLNHDMRVAGENWWEKEIALPTDRPSNNNNHYVYYISEDNPDGTTNGQTEVYQQPKFFKLVGDEVVDDYYAYNLISNPTDFGNNSWNKKRDEGWTYNGRNEHAYVSANDAQDSTLIVMNAPRDGFQHVRLFKTWYKYNNQGQLVQASSNDVKKYAVGLQVYQRLKQEGAEWAPFANPFYISTSRDVIDCNGQSYINEDNPFKFNDGVQDDNGVWKWLFIQYDGIRNAFPRYGLVNGHKVEYEYEIREFGVYTGNHASKAEDLTRVYDYTSAKDWFFDEQHKDAQNNDRARGINVQAGKLKVTKNWQDGHVGSKIYFKVYRGNEDITDQIVADPDSYHLNEHQVIDDGTHKALIVKSDGKNWEELLIEGLPVASASGGTPYEYSIKEIGYSEADGTDCWDGEPIIESDGSHRIEPSGAETIVHVSDLLTGYTIDGSGNASPLIDGKSGSVTFVEDNSHTIQVNNKYVERYKDFEFTKVWRNANGDLLTWPTDVEEIVVDLYANDTKVKENISIKPAPAEQTFEWDGITYRVEVSVDQSGKFYTFKIRNLPSKIEEEGNKVDAVYSVRETAPAGYAPKYGEITITAPESQIIKSFGEVKGAVKATDGKAISNDKESPDYEIVIVKVDTGNTDMRLGGAKFDLYAATSIENDTVKEGEQPLQHDLVTSSDNGENKGKVSLGQLETGTYYLFETKAPSGYVQLDKPVRIVIEGDAVTIEQGTSQRSATITQNKAELTVMNSAGVELPQTGGAGTAMFYIFGTLLMAGAIGLGAVRRRRSRA